jgi:hypothetical protein
MKSEYILSFEQIKELANSGITVGELKKRVDEYNELNKIRCAHELANINLSKCLKESKQNEN